MLDTFLAYVHYLCIFAAFGLLLTELLLLPTSRWQLLSRVDLGYFISAIALLLTGLGRVLFGLKGTAYYWHDLWFHALWITYLLIALLSIVPTISFIRWTKAERAEAGFVPPAPALRHVRGHIAFELLLFCIAPLFAVLMARGYGT